MSAAIKLTENEGREEVVRIEDDGRMHTGLPASQQREKDGKVLPVNNKKRGNLTKADTKEDDFSINVVSVRNVVVKGRIKNKSHEEFIVRTRRKGKGDTFVARRYGDFVRLAETVRILLSLGEFETQFELKIFSLVHFISFEKNVSKKMSKVHRLKINAQYKCKQLHRLPHPDHLSKPIPAIRLPLTIPPTSLLSLANETDSLSEPTSDTSSRTPSCPLRPHSKRSYSNPQSHSRRKKNTIS